MTRTIVSKNDVVASAADFQGAGNDELRRSKPKAADAYVDKLLKLIPAEIVAIWVTLRATFEAAAQTAPTWLQWAAFLILAVLTPIYLVKTAGVSKMTQVWISTGAFLVWAFSLGGVPFATLPKEYVLPIFGAILLPLYTFAAPLLNVD